MSAAERLPIFLLFDDKEELLFDDNLDNVPLESIPLERLGLSATTKMQPVECSGFEPRWKRMPLRCGTFCTIGSRRLNLGEWVTAMW